MRELNRSCCFIGIFTLSGVVDREDLSDGDGGGAEGKAIDKVWGGGERGLDNARRNAADRRVNEVGSGGGLEKVAKHSGSRRMCWVGHVDNVGSGGQNGKCWNVGSGGDHWHLGSQDGGGNDSCVDGGGGGDGNSSGSGFPVVCHCGAEAVLVCHVLNVPDPAVGVSDSVGAGHDVAVSALLPLL